MQAIEFETQTHNGTIELPAQFRPWKDCLVRVIILVEETNPPTQSIKDPYEIIKALVLAEDYGYHFYDKKLPLLDF